MIEGKRKVSGFLKVLAKNGLTSLKPERSVLV